MRPLPDPPAPAPRTDGCLWLFPFCAAATRTTSGRIQAEHPSLREPTPAPSTPCALPPMASTSSRREQITGAINEILIFNGVKAPLCLWMMAFLVLICARTSRPGPVCEGSLKHPLLMQVYYYCRPHGEYCTAAVCSALGFGLPAHQVLLPVCGGGSEGGSQAFLGKHNFLGVICRSIVCWAKALCARK